MEDTLGLSPRQFEKFKKFVEKDNQPEKRANGKGRSCTGCMRLKEISYSPNPGIIITESRCALVSGNYVNSIHRPYYQKEPRWWQLPNHGIPTQEQPNATD